MHDLIMRTAQAVAQAALIRCASWALGKLRRLAIWGVTTMSKAIQGETEYLTASEAGRRLGLTAFEVTRTYERGFLPPAKKLGRIRMIPAEDLPALKEAAKKAGYPAAR